MRNLRNDGRIVSDGISGWSRYVPDPPRTRWLDVVDLWMALRVDFSRTSAYAIMMDADRGRLVHVITTKRDFTVRRCGERYTMHVNGGDQNAR